MLFHHWDSWRRRRAEAYLAMSPEQRYRHHQVRQILALVTVPGLLFGSASIAMAYGSGLMSKGPAPRACTPTVVDAPARGSFDLSVQNATGEGGLATEVARGLTQRHFRVVDASTAPEDLYVASAGVIYHGSAGLDQALLVQKIVPGSRLFDDGRKGTGVTLVVGSGFTRLAPMAPRDMPRPSDISVNVYNATWRPGLAKQVEDDLLARGFRPGRTGNDPQRSFLPKDVAVIRYGPDGDLAARRLGEHVAGARLVADGSLKGTTVDLVLGNAFAGLRTLAEVPALPPVKAVVPETVARPCAT